MQFIAIMLHTEEDIVNNQEMLILGCGNSQDLNTIYVCLPKV